jgi:hypothetical protein
MVARPAVGKAALRTLAVIRIVNGTLGLAAPAVLVKRVADDPLVTAPFYPFRLFGVRTVVLGADLLLLRGAALDRARKEAVIIHCADTVCAAIGGLRGEMPPRAARATVAISALNTALAVLAVLAVRYAKPA